MLFLTFFIYRIGKLEEEFLKKGIDVDENICSILENLKDDPVALKNEFLREWWSKQKELQSLDNKSGYRYPPSVIR